jgi:RND superfamily putative drug exporter
MTLRRLAEFTVRRPKVVLVAVLGLIAIGIVFGGTVSEKLGVGGFVDPAAESTQADAFLDKTFGATSNLVLQVVARNGTVDNPDVVTAADRVRRLVEAEPSAKVIGSFRQDPDADLRSRDGHSGLILVHVTGTTEDAAKAARRIIDSLPTDDPAVTVRAGGSLGVQTEIQDRVDHDLLVSESIALPISLGVLVIVFGGLIAAFLPIAVGLTSIVTTLLVLLIMTRVTDVSVHALTVATAFGLGLSIDFGLLMVSRFREERDRKHDHQSAIIATVTTAGRTIIFSAATVTLAMACLLVFPTYFLRSVGLTASAVVILSAISAIVVLPALLSLLGRRIDSIALVRRKAPLSADSLFWRRCAQAVTRRPLLHALPVVAVLLALGIPFLSVQLELPDERALPSRSDARMVTESLREEYSFDSSQAITLVARTNPDALKDLAAKVSLMDGVIRVEGPIGTYESGRLVADRTPRSGQSQASYAFVYLSVDGQSAIAQQLVHDIRAKITDHQVEVGGPTATLIDSRAAIFDRLGWAILLIALSTFVLLFLFTGSVVVPIKALVLNLLVLSAVLGLMVWIFQEGHLAPIVGITPAPLNLSMVVLLCCMAFSLSVDYEIFLLSRIKEARDSGMSNNDAIAVGMGRVGRIITSAAILLTITLISFANGLSFMKMFGIGTALAIVIDATVIRGVVVPAFLRLAGDLNWWAPRPLKWLHARIGVSETPLAEPLSAGAAEPQPALAAPAPTPELPAQTPQPFTAHHVNTVPRIVWAANAEADAHDRPPPRAVIQSSHAAPAAKRAPPEARPAGQDARPVRPPAAVGGPLVFVILDDNSRFELDRDCVIGSDPDASDAVRQGLRSIRIQGRTGGISRAHAEIRRNNDEVLLVDRGSTNGVFLHGPGQQAWTRIRPWQPVRWFPGASVRIGSRILRLHVAAPQRLPSPPVQRFRSALNGSVGSNGADRGKDREHREQPPGRSQIPADRHIHHYAC